jgi:hypothetical protein
VVDSERLVARSRQDGIDNFDRLQTAAVRRREIRPLVLRRRYLMGVVVLLP